MWRPRTRAQAVLAVGVVLALVAGVALAVVLWPRPAASPTASSQTMTLSATTLRRTISATGTIQPEKEASLAFLTSGTVSSVAVAVGDGVAAGQELASIDPSSARIARQSAVADLAAARSTLSDLESSSSSTSSTISAAKATVQVKENALAQADKNLANTTLTAPFDGVVAQVNVVVGDTAGTSGTSAGSGQGGAQTTTSSSTAAIVVITKGSYTVDTSVAVGDVASMKKGLQAVITPTGSTTAVYGTVSSVGVVATSSSSTAIGSTSGGSTTFPVTIKVTGTQNDLLAGSSASVEIVTAQFTDVLAVPTTALSTADGATTVKTMVGGAEVTTPVTTGEVVGNQTIITAGLAEGDQVVVPARVVSQAGTGQDGSSGFPGGGFPGGGMPPGGFPQGGFPGGGTGGPGGGRG